MRPLLACLLLLPACELFERPADEGPHCEDTPRAVAFDEVTPLGFSAADILEGVPTDEVTTLRYADGTETELAVGFRPGTEARFVDSEAVYPEGGVTTDIGVICEDRLEIDGALDFGTADSAFAESFESVLLAGEQGVTIRQELDLDGLAGTFDIVPFVEAEGYSELRAWIAVTFADGVSAGVIEGQASGEDECEDGDECTAWAASVDVGAWPSE